MNGTPLCPTCSRPVYHAEQTIGPGRKMYHKPCLVCSSCKTRVDPGALQEHAGEAYCRNCHRMLFSPRDLRSANVYTGSPAAGPSRSSPSTTPSRPSRTTVPAQDLTSTPDRPKERGLYTSVDEAVTVNPVGSSTGEVEKDTGYVPFRVVPRSDPFDATRTATASAGDSSWISTPGSAGKIPPAVKPKPPAFSGSTSGMPSHAQTTPTSDPPFSTPNRTHPTSTPSRSRTYGAPVSNSIVRAGFSSSPSSTGSGDVCPTCGKKVFLMEAVNALSRKWHKACLKCTECNSTLDANRLCDKDGSAYCKRCYGTLFGPGGVR